MANYLLSGGAGFLGSHFAESLLHDGHEVTILDNFTTGTLQNFDREIYERDALTIIEHDVTKPLPVDPEYDVVTHLASIPTPGEYMNRPVDTLRTGSLGTRRTLDLAVESNATYLLTSTSEVYGDPEAHPQPESYNGDVDPFGPRSCYDEGKRYAEALTRAYRQEYGLNVRVARIFNTYGPRMRDDRVIPAFVAQAQAGDDLTIHGDGTQTRSFCYVTDLIRGFRALLKSDCRTPVNLGNPDERTIADLAGIVCDVTESKSELTHTKRPPDDPDRRCPDISLARNRLGCSPSV
jgi:dTDP-glucose 4,6-dehydratase